MTPHDHARQAADAGISVIPIGTNKRPLISWEAHQRAPAGHDQIDDWWTRWPDAGIGWVCGAVSGHLELVEFEAAAAPLWGRFKDECARRSLDLDLFTLVVRSPTGGLHLLYRCPDGIDANQRLAVDADGQVLVETRGEGGYVVGAGTAGNVHPLAKPWVAQRGSVDTIPTISAAQRRTLHAAAAAVLDARTRPAGDDTPWDHYDATHTCHDVLRAAGFTTRGPDRKGDTHYTRPGKDPRSGTSATVWADNGTATLFSTAVAAPDEFVGDRNLTAWKLHVALDHGGDFRAAAAAWRRQMPTGGTAPAPDGTVEEAATERGEGLLHGWETTDLAAYATGAAPHTPLPAIGAVDGGAPLLYAARTNGLHGESGSGKSWVALHIAAEQINDGHHVVYIDLEDHHANIAARLVALGVRPADIAARLTYISPQLAWSQTAADHVCGLVTDTAATLVVIDSTGEALALQGAKQNDDDAVATWHRLVPRTLAALGPAVLLIDHMPKAKDAPQGFAIGSQRKKAAIDGALFRVEQVVSMGKGRAGKAHLTTSKDRNGTHPTGTIAADFTLATDEDGQRSVARLVGHVGLGDPGFRPTVLMERISRHLEHSKALTGRQVEAAVEGKSGALREALRVLVEEGWLHAADAGPATYYSSARPYRADDDAFGTDTQDGTEDAERF